MRAYDQEDMCIDLIVFITEKNHYRFFVYFTHDGSLLGNSSQNIKILTKHEIQWMCQ